MNARANPPAAGEASQVPGPDKPAVASKPRGGRRIVLMVSVPLLLAVGGGWLWLSSGRYVSTEDAYVQETKALISADVAGRIVEVDVSENQSVKKGDVLYRLDPQPFRIALASAEAALASARQNVAQLKVAYQTAQAKQKAAEDALAIQERLMNRQSDLADKGVSSKASLDQLRIAFQQAQESVALARQGVAAAAAALGGDPGTATDDVPAVQAALANVDSARLDLDRATVKAPADGIVSQTDKLNIGQYASEGSAMLTLVETGDVWVEANLKETELTDIELGQKASVSVDAYPGLAVTGVVQSIGAGTGSEFSLIPAQNATGNWVKVVQRLPVRITLSGADLDKLRTGMSVGISIDTGKNRMARLFK
ncbi:MAG TPA: HlyD family secretion protein [Devosiaceae bacterium]